MKKSKIIALIAALIVTVSVFGGCKKTVDDSKPSDEQITTTGGNVGRENLTYSAIPNKYVVKYGVSDYKIVVPKVAPVVVSLAATELRDFIKKSTECDLPIITDDEVSDGGKYLSVGQTTLLRQTDIDYSYEKLATTGVSVTRIGDNVYLVGATNYGTLYSVYRFLKMTIGFEAYSNEVIIWDEKKTVPLYDFSYSYVPTAKGGGIYSMKDYWGSEYALDCARMYSYASGWGGANSLETSVFDKYWCHTVQSILPESDREEGWMNNGQLCYTNEAMTAKFTENMIKIVDASVSPYIMVGGYDNKTSCDCAKCTADYEKYKTGGVFLRFLNKVGKGVAERLKAIGSDRKVSIMGLAYNAYMDPPVKQVNGEWVPIDETCVAESNVSIMMAPVYGCFTHSLNDPECETNVPVYEQFKGWASVTDHLCFYSYNVFAAAAFYSFNDWTSLSGMAKMFEEFDMEFVNYQGSHWQNGVAPFSKMRYYVVSKLLWNGNYAINELINDFIRNYYGEYTVPYVREFFDNLGEHYEWIYTQEKTECQGVFYPIAKANLWPRNTLLRFEESLNKAKIAIDGSGYSIDEEERRLERVDQEYCFIKYIEINYYKAFYSDDEYNELISDIKSKFEKWGVVNISENIPIP